MKDNKLKISIIYKILGASIFISFFSYNVEAALLYINADQNADLASDLPDRNYYQQSSASSLTVGDSTQFGPRQRQTMLGFDVTALNELSSNSSSGQIVINRMTISLLAYTNNDDTSISISLGNKDAWDSNIVTWNTSANDFGASIDEVFIPQFWGSAFLARWDVSNIHSSEYTTDSYLTFYLHNSVLGNSNAWTNFYSINGNVIPRLTIDYSIVPIPAAIWLFGSGLIVLASITRRNKN